MIDKSTEHHRQSAPGQDQMLALEMLSVRALSVDACDTNATAWNALCQPMDRP